MTKTLEAFYQEEQQKREQVKTLNGEILSAQESLIIAQEDYEKAVIENNDTETARLSKEIESLQSQIQEDTHKFRILEKSVKPYLKQQAIEAVRSFPLQATSGRDQKITLIAEKIETAKQTYIQQVRGLIGEVEEANQAVKDTGLKYWQLIEKVGIQKEELDDQLFMEIDKLAHQPGDPMSGPGIQYGIALSEILVAE